MGNLGFPLAPYPYYSLLADDISALHEEGVSGYFAQAAAAGGADMSELVRREHTPAYKAIQFESTLCM